jgi:hypothetical protein
LGISGGEDPVRNMLVLNLRDVYLFAHSGFRHTFTPC